jgi:proline dehydrogenase
MTSLFDHLVVSSLPFVPKAVVGRVASRYVAGETLDDAIATIRGLAAEGAEATCDVLGESVTRAEQTRATTREYLVLLDALANAGLPGNVSVKPTAIGLSIDPALALENGRAICAKAKEHGTFVRIDMEDSSVTGSTLKLALDLRAGYDSVGVVVQAYLRRTLADLDPLIEARMSVRVCKGIYVEPRRIAYQERDVVRRNYATLVEKLLRGGCYVGIATHDEACVQSALDSIDRLGVSRDRYEFQMLLGVDPLLRKILVEAGHRLRVYVPYGRDWYAYSIRRLKENPSISRHVVRATLGRGPSAS